MTMRVPPITIIAFRRPDLTRRVLEAVAEVRPQKLFVFTDGPRPDHPEDESACAETRAVFDSVDWDCDVVRNFSDRNLGCGRGPSSGFSWVFEQVEEAVFLEDDCVPDPSFFEFCGEMLERYRDDERVMHISGSTLRSTALPIDESYCFSQVPACWGWAGWRRAWRHFDLALPSWPELKETSWLMDLFENEKAVAYWAKLFDRAHDEGGDVSYWDYQWAYACWANSGLTVVPRVNLVTNIGWGEGATHTFNDNDPTANLKAHALDMPLKHPERVLANRDLDRRYFREVIHRDLYAPPVTGWPLWKRRIGRVVPAPLRRLRRRLMAKKPGAVNVEGAV